MIRRDRSVDLKLPMLNSVSVVLKWSDRIRGDRWHRAHFSIYGVIGSRAKIE